MTFTVEDVENPANDLKSPCCDKRIEVIIKRINTIAGTQIVYACIKCTKLYIAGES